MLKNEFEPRLYAAINKQEALRMQSASGGVFSAIAENFIDSGGIVIAPAFGADMRLKHTCADTKEALEAMRGSKYVRSSMKDVYGIIKKNASKPILFCGTPCQAGAVRSYFDGMENLYVLDVVCHGVPMKKVFRQYIKSLEEKHGSKVESIDFRKKTPSWRRYAVAIAFENGKQRERPVYYNAYMQGFIDGLYLTKACYACKFKGVKRPSDLTLGDFWGIEHFDRSMDDDRGTSLVIINSEKGMELFDRVQNCLKVKQTDEEAAVKYNPGITESTKEHPNREAFLQALDEKGFDDAAAECIPVPKPWRYQLSRIKHKLLGR